MNKSVATKWVKALRSGKYKQGYKHLRRDNKYCCLGVLCEIMGTPGNRVLKVLDGETQLRSGMNSSTGILNGWNITSLSRINDSKQYVFDEIADIIQMCWEEL